jgi:thioredoxin-related protein
MKITLNLTKKDLEVLSHILDTALNHFNEAMCYEKYNDKAGKVDLIEDKKSIWYQDRKNLLSFEKKIQKAIGKAIGKAK